MTRWKNGVQADMTDYIKREDAIGIVKNLKRFSCFGDDGFVEIPMVYCELMEVAPADVAPVRHGHWIVIDAEEPRRYGCSECKRLSWHMENYCPFCGSKMDGGDD